MRAVLLVASLVLVLAGTVTKAVMHRASGEYWRALQP